MVLYESVKSDSGVKTSTRFNSGWKVFNKNGAVLVVELRCFGRRQCSDLKLETAARAGAVYLKSNNAADWITLHIEFDEL